MMSGGHRILLMLVGVSLLTSGQADCPTGDWEESRGSCYLFVLEPLSQANAQTICIEQEGNMTSVVDEEENNFLYNLSLARCGEESCPSVWFGLTKMGNLTSDPKEGGWSWFDVSTYDNGNYKKWEEGEPSGGVACARMYVKDANGVAGKWGDYACGTSFPYVCKRRATAPSTTTTATTTAIYTPTTTTTTTAPAKSSTLFYFGACLGVGVLVSIIVVIIVVVIVVKRRNKSERLDVTNSQSAPSGGDGDAGGEGEYSYVEVRAAKIMKEMMAEEGIYSEANIDAESQDVDTASEASVSLPPPTVGRPSVTSPSQSAPKPSDVPEDSKSGDYDNDPVSPTTHKVADSVDEYALVTRSDNGEMTMAPLGGQ